MSAVCYVTPPCNKMVDPLGIEPRSRRLQRHVSTSFTRGPKSLRPEAASFAIREPCIMLIESGIGVRNRTP